ncbi:MAG: hypothetical protein L0Y70_29030, partial [Gemmataceae bacterium]|nr:hypothetical protein [Gemmataceae bacterium]
ILTLLRYIPLILRFIPRHIMYHDEIINVAIGILIVLLVLIVLQPPWYTSLLLIIPTLFGAWLMLGAKRPKSELKEPLQEADASLIDNVARTATGMGFLVFMMLLITFFTYGFGHTYARNKEGFLVRLSKPNEVLAAVYGESFVFVEYNPDESRLTGVVRVLTTDKVADEQLRFTHIGTLAKFNPREKLGK